MAIGRKSIVPLCILALSAGAVCYSVALGQSGEGSNASSSPQAQANTDPNQNAQQAQRLTAQADNPNASLTPETLAEVEAHASKLKDNVPAEERREAIAALFGAYPDGDAPPALVALLDQRAPRKPFEQLVNMLSMSEHEGYRRAGLVRPLALALVRGDPAGESIARALSSFSDASRLLSAHELLNAAANEEFLAGAALARTRPGGASGVLELAPRLVALMSLEANGVGARAFEALREITLLDFGSDALAWQRWLDEKDRAEKLAEMADAAVLKVRTLQDTNARLFKSYLREIEAKIQRERAADPDALLRTLDEEYPQIRALAARLLGTLLPTLPPESAQPVVDAIAERLQASFEEAESVQIALARALASRPVEAAEPIRNLLLKNGISASVKLELIKGLTRPDSLEVVTSLLALSAGEYADPVQLQLIEQLKLVADPTREELMSDVFRKFTTRLREEPPESARSPYRREMAAIIDTLRFLLTIKAQPIQTLIPELLAFAKRGVDDRAPVFELLIQSLRVHPDQTRELLLAASQYRHLQAMALGYTVEFQLPQAASASALARLLAALATLTPELQTHLHATYEACWVGEGDWPQRDELATSMSRALIASASAETRGAMVSSLLMPASVAGRLPKLPAYVFAKAEGESEKKAEGAKPGDSGEENKRAGPNNFDGGHSDSDGDSVPLENEGASPIVATDPALLIGLREGVVRVVVTALTQVPQLDLGELSKGCLETLREQDFCMALGFARRLVREIPQGDARTNFEKAKAELESTYRGRLAKALAAWQKGTPAERQEIQSVLRVQLTLSCAPHASAEFFLFLESHLDDSAIRDAYCPLLEAGLKKVDPQLAPKDSLKLDAEGLKTQLAELRPKLVERSLLKQKGEG